MPIDTLKASKRLKALGFTEEQAEGVAALLNETDAASATKDDLYALESRLDERFERIDARFEQIDARFERIDARFEAQNKRIDEQFETQNARIDEHFETQQTRFDEQFEAQQARFDERFEAQQARFDERFKSQSAQMEALEAKLKNYVTSRVGWAAGLLALYLTLLNYLLG